MLGQEMHHNFQLYEMVYEMADKSCQAAAAAGQPRSLSQSSRAFEHSSLWHAVSLLPPHNNLICTIKSHKFSSRSRLKK